MQDSVFVLICHCGGANMPEKSVDSGVCGFQRLPVDAVHVSAKVDYSKLAFLWCEGPAKI